MSDLPLNTIVATLYAFIPGLCGILIYQHGRRLPLPDLGKIHIALLALCLTAILNACLFSLVPYGGERSLFDNSLFDQIGSFLNWAKGDTASAKFKVLESYQMIAYWTVMIVVPAMCGSLLGFIRYLYTPASISERTFVRSRNVLTVVDILTTDGTLYRGIFHSLDEVEKGIGQTLNLSLCSKWLKPTASEGGSASYTAIKSTITRQDLVRMIVQGEKQNQKDKKKIPAAITEQDTSAALMEYFNVLLSKPPQMSFFPVHILNINTMLFIVA